MGQPRDTASSPTVDAGAADRAWEVVLDAAGRAEALALAGVSVAFACPGALSARHPQALVPVPPSHPEAMLFWNPASGWDLRMPHDDPRHSHIDLYLPICGATRSRPMAVGHLGQSIDGFIATHSGDSRFVTGKENIVHLHRMRALCDAIVVGAGTVAADDPQLTTRHVTGSNPVRVILDPARRLEEHYKVFCDAAVETMYVCGRSTVQDGETTFGRATIVPVDDDDGTIDVAAVLTLLRTRGCHRIFVEGGGVTVSLFLEAGLLDRLQVAIAPLLIGDGRPAVRLPALDVLSECLRPGYRVFRMGGDVFFDCDLRATAHPTGVGEGITRII